MKAPLKNPGIKTVLAALALLAVCIVHIPLLYANAADMADDAMISARYARNLAWGHGLRYNRSPESEKPVEGYSNFLWVMGLCAGYNMQLHPRVTTAYTGAAFSLLTVISLSLWVMSRTARAWPGLIAGLVLATSQPFSIWAVQGLETPMFAALMLASVALVRTEKPSPLPFLAASLASMARPDGLLAAAAVFTACLLQPGRDPRPVLKSSLGFIIPFGIYTAWRVLHFGELIPNVFHARTGLGLAGVMAGARYLLAWAADQWHMALLLVLGTASLLWKPNSLVKRPDLLAPVSLALFYLAFIAWAGGDFMPDHRFVMHVLPVMVGLGFFALAGISSSRAKRLAVLVFLAFVLAYNAAENVQYHSGSKYESQAAEWHRDQAEWYGRTASWLLHHTEQGDAIACGDIGYIGYVTDVDRILDTNGLVDPYLARRPGAAALSSDPDYVLDREPAYLVVMVHYFQGGEVLGHSAFDRAVLAGERLGKEYELAVELPGWRSMERSMDDGIKRRSRVRFRIYKRRGP